MSTRTFFPLILVALLFTVSCAESANSPVAPFIKGSNGGGNSQLEEGEATLKAVRYDGRTSLGLTCKLYLSQSQQRVLVKVDYTAADGYRPADDFAVFKKYDPSTGRYDEPEEVTDGSQLVLASLRLNAGHSDELNPDFNEIPNYIQRVELFQSSRIELRSETNKETFLNALVLATTPGSQFEDVQATLNQIVNIDLAARHGDHYDFPNCRNFQASGVEEITYHIGESHEEDEEEDHDHDHDHD